MLSKNAQNIQDFLLEKGIDAKVIELLVSARTADDAAKAIGCEVAHIIKSLIFRTKQTNRPILILASGSNRVDEKLISQFIGEDIIKADASFTKEVTGFAIGGVPPIGYKQMIDTYIDRDLLQYKELWAAAGTPHAVFNLKSSRLENLTNGKVISIKKANFDDCKH